MNKPFWALVAFIVSSPKAAQWLIQRAQRTPYTHIMSADGTDCYMGRWWLFNPYPASGAPKRKGWGWLPSVRIHHIMREDQDRDLHDHPWNARTIVLRGFYIEQVPWASQGGLQVRVKEAGDTGRLLFGEYHRICNVSPGGVWTLFITWQQRGEWGFMVDGAKVPWRTYLGLSAQPAAAHGVRCHNDTCSAGQLPCPTRQACGIGAEPGPAATPHHPV